MNVCTSLTATDPIHTGAVRRGARLWISLLLIAVFANLAICMSEHRHAPAPQGTAALDHDDGGAPADGARLADGCSICSAVAACAMLGSEAAGSGIALASAPLHACAASAGTASRAIALPDSRAPPIA
jgi:hypothetical protein